MVSVGVDNKVRSSGAATEGASTSGTALPAGSSPASGTVRHLKSSPTTVNVAKAT